LVENLRACATSFFSEADKCVKELLLRWYPELTDKELQTCIGIIWTLHDHCSRSYVEILAQMLRDQQSSLFGCPEAAQMTIDGLIAKGIISSELAIIGYRCGCGSFDNITLRPSRCLLLEKKIEEELLSAISETLCHTRIFYFSSAGSTTHTQE
ncbi:MAG: hypothetical protein ACRD5H_15070, partial [Nitrososphaerales archaeon]